MFGNCRPHLKEMKVQVQGLISRILGPFNRCKWTSPIKSKVKAIKEAPSPTTVTEHKSFLS